MGLLMTELQYEYTRSVLVVTQKASKEEFAQVNSILADLNAEARAQLLGDGVPTDTHRFTAVAECRYVGQGFELRAAMPDGPLEPDNVKSVIRSFFEAHKQVYGHAFEDQLVEIITLRVVGLRRDRHAEAAGTRAWRPDQSDDGRSSISATRCSTTAKPYATPRLRSREAARRRYRSPALR